MKYVLISLLAFVISFRTDTDPVEITGKVIDGKTGDPVASVVVQVRNHSISTTTGNDGTFSIVAPATAKALVFSYVGYKTVIYKITKENRNIVIKMEAAEAKLEEAVVTGLGVADATPESHETVKKQLTGRVSGISGNKSRHRQSNSGSQPAQFNTEDYDAVNENIFLESTSNPLSTFSIDVDGASYSNVRRYLNSGQLPPAGSVRIEELINYFRYKYPQPEPRQPFSINTEAGVCPWNNDHRLVMIGLQGKKIPVGNLPSSNLVFLIDVSGSMDTENKLPLVKSSMKLLTEQLREQDRVSIVVYAGNAGLVLPATNGDEKEKIKEAINALEAGGSTAGGAGIQLAYKIARQNFRKNGNNRVILCTDGDFNVGQSSDAELERMIEKERESGVYLTVLGFGTGNYKDNKMQKLAGKGNGNHAYIDNITEAKKVLVNEFGGTLFAIAKDVKLQIEFNPAHVQGYRLIGYENRMLKKEDFNNDRKDAGDMGSGHTVTALYEVIPTGIKSSWIENNDKLRYQQHQNKGNIKTGELMTIRLRYKDPHGDVSRLTEHIVKVDDTKKKNHSDNFYFATAVAEFGLVLSNSQFKQNASLQHAKTNAMQAMDDDEEGYRKEFLGLIRKSMRLHTQDDDESVGFEEHN